MKRFLRSALSDATYYATRLTNGTSRGVRILTYHRVTGAHPRDRLCVPVARFAEQMRSLHNEGYRTLSLAQAVSWLKQQPATQALDMGQGTGDGGELPHQKAVVITFDDGFEDNFRYAYPVLVRYGFTACFFVPSQFIRAGPQRHPRADRPMSWAQLNELLDGHQEIGSHSITHRRLTVLPVSELHREVRESKAILEFSLHQRIEWFCYPSGAYNEIVKRAVVASGYCGACTVLPGANLPGADPFALRRTEVSGFDSLWDFQKKLAGAYDWLHGTMQGVQRMSRALKRTHNTNNLRMSERVCA